MVLSCATLVFWSLISGFYGLKSPLLEAPLRTFNTETPVHGATCADLADTGKSNQPTNTIGTRCLPWSPSFADSHPHSGA